MPSTPVAPAASGSIWVGPRISNADEVIRGEIHHGAKRCFQRGLEADHDMAGRVVITIHVAANGDVDSAWVSSNPTMPAFVGDCIVEAAKHAHFLPPGGDGSTMTVPFNLVRRDTDGGA